MIARLHRTVLMAISLSVTFNADAQPAHDHASASEERDTQRSSPSEETKDFKAEASSQESETAESQPGKNTTTPANADTNLPIDKAAVPTPLNATSAPTRIPTIDKDTGAMPMESKLAGAVANMSGPPSQELSLLEEMGQPFGAGHFSLLPSAHRMQLSAALDQTLSFGLADGKLGGHPPIFSTEALLRLSHENTGTRALWLGAAIKPIGVSRAYPHNARLSQRGQAIQSLSLIEYRELETGTLRLQGGIVSQHLGRSDTLYWSSLLPGKLSDESLRLFDNALGLNTVYAYKNLYTRIDVGQPIKRNSSPFASGDGLRIQMISGWVDGKSSVFLGGRIERLNNVDEQELNLSWRLSLKQLSAKIPMTIYGELGSITQPEINEYALGALYAHHELAFELESFQLRTRYDWIDRDTYFKYDTTHLVRCALDFQVVKYVNLSAQYRHRWTNSTDRSSSENDDIMMFVQLLY